MIEMGRIVQTHGVSGEVKIRSSCDSPAFLSSFKTLYINTKPYRVLSARQHKDALLVRLESIDSVDDAMALLGAEVTVPEDIARSVLPQGRHYIRDLIGCQVITLDDCAIGQLEDVLTLPAHDVYIVGHADGQVMIPVVNEFVKQIDVAAKIITVQLIEGMLP